MKINMLIFFYLTSSLFLSTTITQSDSLSILADTNLIEVVDEIQSDGPPCGIPCLHVFDEHGKFLYCVSPCCNCNELYGDKDLALPLPDPEPVPKNQK